MSVFAFPYATGVRQTLLRAWHAVKTIKSARRLPPHNDVLRAGASESHLPFTASTPWAVFLRRL